ncbi:MAG: hypothetical protein CMF72_24735 [Mameliella sp.]|nr:hypothetical protein [Mameliella sp.]
MATKFKGKNLSFTVDGEEFNADGTSVVLDSEDSADDATTFAELQDGDPQDWFFNLTAISDYASTSFWSVLWDNAGEDLAFIFKPYGNADASTSEPHFTGTVTVPKKPPVGGDAGTTWTYTMRLDCTDEPVRVTAPA